MAITIGLSEGELCSELGPLGFRCDWGRILHWHANDLVEMKWQISSKREPIPNGEQSSNLRVSFTPGEKGLTIINLIHYNFNLHGCGGVEYYKMMDSQYGWDYLLTAFKSYCDRG